MKESTSREKVLKNIRNALITKTDIPFPYIDCDASVYNERDEAPEIIFAEEFTKVGGQFIFCENRDEFFINLKNLIKEKKWVHVFCKDEKLKKQFDQNKISVSSLEEDFLSVEAGITSCEYIVARLGSIIVSSKQIPGRKGAVYPPVHIVVSFMSQLVPDLKDAISGLKNRYKDSIPSMVSIITGPSRTADIEKTLVMGAHGPKDLYCFLIDDSVI
jgi:L-lactate dehydrogenase complex protein LldG